MLASVRAEAGGLIGEVRAWRAQVPRAEAACRHFGDCGGCRLQHLKPEDYRIWLGRRIERALARHGLLPVEIRRPEITPARSRRRLRLGFVRAGGRCRLGLRARAGHRIVELDQCPISRPAIVALLEPLRSVLGGLGPTSGEVLITETDSGLDVVLLADGQPDLEARERLARFAANEDLARLAWSSAGGPAEELASRRPVIVTFEGVPVRPPAAAFLQASVEAERIIRRAVVEALGPVEPLADLYAGCGTFALPLGADGRRVLAVDGDAAMIDALSAAAASAGLGQRVTTRVQDLERRPLQADQLGAARGVVLDPPRAGARNQVRVLSDAAVERIAMVSCNPPTFARDARLLVDGGFRLAWVQPIDAFLWSAEVELVGALHRSAFRT